MMKKSLKKLVTGALAVSMTVALAGCGGGSSDNNGGGASSSKGSSESSSGNATTINVYRATYNVNQTDEAELSAVQDAINAKLKEKGASVAVNISDIPNAEYGDKANLALANGEVDLLWTASWWGTIGTNDLYQQNAAYDLTDLLPDTTLYKSMPEWYWRAAQYDGKDYFVPVYKEGAEGYDMKALNSNAEKYGLDIENLFDANASLVDNLAKLEPYLQKAADDGIKYPYNGSSTAMFYRFGMDYYDFFEQPLMSMIGVNIQTNEVENPIQSKEYADYCKLMGRWGEKKYLNVDEEVGKTIPATACQTQDWLVNWWTDIPNNAESFGRDGNQEETFGHLTKNYSNSHTTLGSCFAVSASCDETKAKACVEFLGYLFTDKEIGDLYTYGIEGTDYVLKDGKVDRTEDAGIDNAGALYNHSPWESTSVEAVTLLTDEPDDKVEMYTTFNDGATTSPASGFRFDHSSVDAQYTAILSVFEQYGFLLEVGGVAEKDVDSTIETYQKALDEAGYQDVLKAAQDQYNEWKSANS